MPRIAGKDIPDNKKVPYALTSIYGIGLSLAQDIIEKAKINPDKRAKELDGQEINSLQKLLENFITEGDLRRQISDNIGRLQRIKTYRGARHSAGLPVRGQRTRVNARTRKGKKKTVGSISKEAATKIEGNKES